MRVRCTAGTLIPAVMLAAVAAMVAAANLRRSHPAAGGVVTSAQGKSGRGLLSTSRESLEGRILEMEQRIANRPEDGRTAAALAEALLRQARVTGNPGLSGRAEQVLRRAADADPGSYDVTRMLGSLYLAQHRFRKALEVAERCRTMRPADPFNYGVMGDAHLELGEYDEAFDALDRKSVV